MQKAHTMVLVEEWEELSRHAKRKLYCITGTLYTLIHMRCMCVYVVPILRLSFLHGEEDTMRRKNFYQAV